MTEEHIPIFLANAHASVSEYHVPAAVVHRSARTRAEEVDQELLLALEAVFPAVRPEAAELRIGLEPEKQIVRHRRVFFFSSRRRHTRSLRDWSSDVCSSD